MCKSNTNANEAHRKLLATAEHVRLRGQPLKAQDNYTEKNK